MRYPTAIAAAALACLAAAGPVLAQAQAPTPAGGAAPAPVTSPVPATSAVTPVMGQSRLSPEQIASWFAKQRITPAIAIPITDLARIFVDEGNAQNIRGDIAFAQSVLETGWFRYQGSMVKPADNNFSGLGACDSCSRGNLYATPEDGVRAQIQHLWAYADPNADPTRTARPLTDLRFHYVKPYGKAPTWEAMGDGNWATGGGYTEKILGLYASMLRHNGMEPQFTTLRTIASDTPTGPFKALVTRRGAVRLGDLRAVSRGTLSSAREAFGTGSTRAVRGTCRVTWSSLGAVMIFAPGTSGATCGDDAQVRAAVLTGPQWRTSKGLKPGDGLSKVRRLYGKKAARGRTSVLVRSRSGARLALRMREGVVKAMLVSVPRTR